MPYSSHGQTKKSKPKASVASNFSQTKLCIDRLAWSCLLSSRRGKKEEACGTYCIVSPNNPLRGENLLQEYSQYLSLLSVSYVSWQRSFWLRGRKGRSCPLVQQPLGTQQPRSPYNCLMRLFFRFFGRNENNRDFVILQSPAFGRAAVGWAVGVYILFLVDTTASGASTPLCAPFASCIASSIFSHPLATCKYCPYSVRHTGYHRDQGNSNEGEHLNDWLIII